MASLLVHLRLHFQLLLAPVFLWGWLLADGGRNWGVLLGFVAFHLFLYSGATAFNSYYDQDVGPVGGLERPPRVTPTLLPFSLVVQALGWALAALVNLPFWLAYTAFLALSIAYSHPKVRWKAHTLTSLLVVGLGQGALAFVAAWAASRGELRSALNLDGALGVGTAVLLILALYPLTQLYQVDEDAARGDRTVAVVWGTRHCFSFAVACTLLGGACMLVEVARRFGTTDAALVAFGLAAQIAGILRLAHGFDARQVVKTYQAVMRMHAASSGALGAYLVVRLALSSG